MLILSIRFSHSGVNILVCKATAAMYLVKYFVRIFYLNTDSADMNRLINVSVSLSKPVQRLEDKKGETFHLQVIDPPLP